MGKLLSKMYSFKLVVLFAFLFVVFSNVGESKKNKGTKLATRKRFCIRINGKYKIDCKKLKIKRRRKICYRWRKKLCNRFKAWNGDYDVNNKDIMSDIREDP